MFDNLISIVNHNFCNNILTLPVKGSGNHSLLGGPKDKDRPLLKTLFSKLYIYVSWKNIHVYLKWARNDTSFLKELNVSSNINGVTAIKAESVMGAAKRIN